MALKLITAASALAVSVAEAKLQANIDTAEKDARITAYILSAALMAEQALGGRALMAQTWELTLDAFPPALELTRTPVASVTSVKYTDTAGVLQTLASNLYTLDAADDYGSAYLVPVFAGAWPSTRDQVNAVAVRYVAGYADAASVPEAIKLWIVATVATMFDNPASEDSKPTYKPSYIDRLLDGYKVYRV